MRQLLNATPPWLLIAMCFLLFAGICAAFVCVFLAVVLLLNAWADFRKPRGGN